MEFWCEHLPSPWKYHLGSGCLFNNLFGKISVKRAVANFYINKLICNALQMDYRYNTVLYFP